MLRSGAIMSIQDPRIPALAVVARVVSILGMGLTFSVAVLALVAAEWVWAGVAIVTFWPFLSLLYVVERLIPERRSDPSDPP